MIDLLSPYIVFSSLQSATPLLLAALAGLLCSRVGVFNMALEGQMLVGAFSAVAFAYATGSDLTGVLAAVLSTMAFSTILAAGGTFLNGNPVVICIGMNLLASGLTAYLLRFVFGVSGTFVDPTVPALQRVTLPFLSGLGPYIAAFNNQTVLTYLSWVSVAACWVFLFKTPLGLRLRGVGENPAAAATLGVNITRFRFVTVVLTGALVGLAGAQLSLGSVTLFSEDMTSGRGWIALVAIMLARDKPVASALACLLFGVTDAFGLRLQSFGVPNQLSGIIPYVITLVALVIFASKRRQAV